MKNRSGAACLAAAGIVSFACAEAFAQDVSAGADLEQLIVRGARVPLPASRSGSAVSILSGTEIRRDARAGVGDILRSMPGIALSRSGGFGALTQLRMRGGEANHVAVFVDGIRVNDPSQSGEFDFAHLLSHDIGRIEIIRGPQSALWGSDALSGVINVVSVTPASGVRLNAAVEAGTQDWQSLTGGVSAAGTRGYVQFNAARVATDGYNVSRTGSERDGYENDSFNLSAGLDLSPGLELGLRLRRIDATSDFDGTDFLTGLPADQLNTTDKEQLLGAVHLTAETFDGRWSHEVRVDRLDTANTTATENAFSATGIDTARADALVDTFVYQTRFAITDSHRLIAALEHRDEEFLQRGEVSFGDPNRDEQMDSDSLILEYDGQITSRLSLLTSWRSDKNSDFEDATTARVTLAYRLGNEQTRLRAAWGEGIKNPTFTERYGFFTDFLGNSELQPEHSTSLELGVDHTFTAAAVRVSATLFDETLEDEINGFVFDPVGGGFTSENQLGESERRGLEVDGGWNFSDAIGLQFALTWLDAEELDEQGLVSGREIRRPERTAGFGLRWTPPARRFDLGMNVAYSSAQDDYFFPPVPPFQERVTLESFTLVTLSGAYSVTDSLRIVGRIENLLDSEYEEVFGFRGVQRQAFVGLRYAFGASR
ncbi:MAG TPA: TonB-dependent receptor [Gammaproteobacteria bacterium]|nr:TonB-dependent receptor [Gammaproteobacteria bacterium]